MARYENGWVKFHRRALRPESMFDGDGYCGWVFMVLLSHANYELGKVPVKKQRIELKKGELITSYRELERKTGFSINCIRRCMEKLKNEKTISIKSGGDGTIISINNYDRYQGDDGNDDTPQVTGQDTGQVTPHDTPQDTIVKNIINKEVKNNIYPTGIVKTESVFDPKEHIENKFLDIWNKNCDPLPKVLKLTAKRKIAIRARLRENSDLGYWESTLQRLLKSHFALGDNNRGWRANIDFFLRPDTHVKINEGYYEQNKTDFAEIEREKRRQEKWAKFMEKN